jgi:hypothetical protein
MLLESANLLIWSMKFHMFDDGVILIPGFDAALSKGDIDDLGRIYRVELTWNEGDVEPLAQEFKHFADSLFEIGDFYSEFGHFGIKPDEDLVGVNTMEVWAKFIQGYNDFNVSPEGIVEYSKAHGITGKIGAVLTFMAYRYCYYVSIDAPEEIQDGALEELARVYVMNRYASKIEKIDMLMDVRDSRSYFPEKYDLSLDDFKKLAFYMELQFNIPTKKGKIFFEKTRTDEDTEKLYNELINLDV